ncbi:hypothetical protein [Halorientalis halophila]
MQTRVDQKLGERDRERSKALPDTAATLEDLEQQLDQIAWDFEGNGSRFV